MDGRSQTSTFNLQNSKTFPSNEKYILSNQIVRASISITSNIAEGFGRKGIKEKIQYYYLSQASLAEVQNQLITAKDVGYLEVGEFNKIYEQSILVDRLLTGLIKSVKKR